MLSAIQEIKVALIEVRALCATVYDPRAEYDASVYAQQRAVIEEGLAQVTALISNLRGVYSADYVSPVLEESISPQRETESTRIQLPLRSERIDILSSSAHYALPEESRAYAFNPSAYPLTGTSIIEGALGESSSRFAFTPSEQDYESAGILVDWLGGVITVRADVKCVTFDNNAAARVSGALDTLSGRPLHYRPIADVAYALAAEPSLSSSAEDVTISQGVLIDREDLVGALVEVGGGRYLVDQGGTLHTFSSTISSSALNGQYHVTARFYSIDMQENVVLTDGYAPDPVYGDIELPITSAKSGDVIFESGVEAGVVIASGEGARGSMYPSYAGGQVSILAETYVSLGVFLSDIGVIPVLSLLDSLVTREDFIETASRVSEISSLVDAVEVACKSLSCPSDVRRVWSDLKAIHIRANLDRAADMLSEAEVDKYLTLDDTSASYGALLSSISEDLIVEVQR